MEEKNREEMRSMEIAVAGQLLPIRTHAPMEDVQEAIELVEARLKDILGQKSLISNKSLLLTSLVLADEVIRKRKETSSFKASIRERSENILERLDREFLSI